MKNLEITSVQTGADRGTSDATGPTIEAWTQVTFRMYRGFDFDKDGPKMGELFRKVIQAVDDAA